ncbi:unnamed protein product [Dovyalis caffra]|uniref:Inositol polyphosphate-related phosphatase domain-containing protein n=1 Tax=Dovyalis caffra TaxID=77055 RepID=A0AAV1S745_9ROSI|nr:unnamed protein product [Dovyalis caffra]
MAQTLPRLGTKMVSGILSSLGTLLLWDQCGSTMSRGLPNLIPLTKDSDYSADTDDEYDDIASDSASDTEEFGQGQRESRFGNNRGEDVQDAIPRRRRRKSETFRTQYINTKEIRICVGTWNVGGILPHDNLDIDDWIDTDDPADIYVFGLQEIVPLNAGNIFGAEDSRPVPKWENIIRGTLNKIRPARTKVKCYSDPPSPSKFMQSEDVPTIEEEILLESDSDIGEEIHPLDEEFNGFDELNDQSITGDMNSNSGVPDGTGSDKLGMPVEQDLQKQFSPPQKLGRLNCLRTEGSAGEVEALAAPKKLTRIISGSERLTLFAELDFEALIKRKRRPSYVRIVSKQMVGIFLTIWVRKSMRERDADELKRNADVREIHRRTQFRPFPSVGLPKSIYDHERIFWLGDLNYRINLPYDKTRDLISRKEWSKLVERDQLIQQLRKGRAFDGWSEGPLNFAPTYKYEMNSEKYYGEDPKAGRRIPAWCDRILSYGKAMRLLNYRRTELKLSDHRPVTATYMAEVEVFSPRKLQRALTFTDAEIQNEEVVADLAIDVGMGQLRLEQDPCEFLRLRLSNMNFKALHATVVNVDSQGRTTNLLALSMFLLKYTWRATAFGVYGYLNFTKSAFMERSKKFNPEDMQARIDGKNCLVTGANSGIGYATAEGLASRGATVYMVCRSKERGEAALSQIQSTTGSKNVHLEVCDLSSVSEIKSFVSRFSTKNAPVHVLVNNAGLLENKQVTTSEGFELNFSVNVLGTYAMTELMLPLLENAAPDARVITVSSGGMYTAPLTTDLQFSKGKFDGVEQYARNKRVQVALTEKWAEMYKDKGISFYSMHPGWAETPGVAKSLPDFNKSFSGKLRTSEEGADTVIWLALQPKEKLVSGAFYFDRAEAPKHLMFSATGGSHSLINNVVEDLRSMSRLSS